jgi:hypothetical protein
MSKSVQLNPNDCINILSWDVGIKHLALCLIKKNIKDNTFTIDKWLNIDLTDDKKFKCGENKKNNVVCGALAKYSCTTTTTTITGSATLTKYYCKTHMGNATVDLTEFTEEHVIKLEDKSLKCKHLMTSGKDKGTECEKIATSLVDNISYCSSHSNAALNRLVKENSIKPLKKNNCMTYDPQTLFTALFKKLSELTFLKNVHEVYIENQPSFKNPTMKTVSTMLFSYFAHYSLQHNLKMLVKFVSPSFKIALTSQLETFVQTCIKEHIKKKDCKCRICKLDLELKANKEKFLEEYSKYKFSYDAVKELGIIYTKKVLKDNKLTDKFKLVEVCDKQDDLCDAFLHGFRRLNK